jgi:hypothetical protein
LVEKVWRDSRSRRLISLCLVFASRRSIIFASPLLLRRSRPEMVMVAAYWRQEYRPMVMPSVGDTSMFAYWLYAAAVLFMP